MYYRGKFPHKFNVFSHAQFVFWKLAVLFLEIPTPQGIFKKNQRSCFFCIYGIREERGQRFDPACQGFWHPGPMGHNATLDKTLTRWIGGRGTTFPQNRHLAHFPHGFWKNLGQLLRCPNTISYLGNICGQTGGDPQRRFSGILHCKQENQVPFQTGTQDIWFEVCGAVGVVEQSPHYFHVDGMVGVFLGEIPYRMREWWRDSIHCCFDVLFGKDVPLVFVIPTFLLKRICVFFSSLGPTSSLLCKYIYIFFSIFIFPHLQKITNGLTTVSLQPVICHWGFRDQSYELSDAESSWRGLLDSTGTCDTPLPGWQSSFAVLPIHGI